MPEATPHPEKTLVRGADGALYLLDKNNPPIKLRDEDAEVIKRLVKDAEVKLSEQVMKDVPIIGSGVNLVIPEIFDD
jgi:hypothetical protein